MFKNRVRLPFYLSKPQFPIERNVFRKADGTSQLLSAVIRNTYEGKTDYIPEDWHRKLIVALAHTEVTIEDTRFLADVVIDGDYGIDWQEFLNNPVAQSTFTIQTTPFNASTSNCQSCADITQLSLEDDYTDEVWDEGTTHEYPDIITANDSICCYPYLIEIMSFETLYFDSVTVTQEGVLTVVIKAITPILEDVLIATYRVTCENGGYDEANIYGNIDGTSTVCAPPTNIQVIPVGGDGVQITWIRNPLPTNGYNYELFLTSDLFNPVESGNIPTNNSIGFSGLIAGESYTFIIESDCGGGVQSVPVGTRFDTFGRTPNSCGSFTITYIPQVSEQIVTASYMDCQGIVQNHTFPGEGVIEVCMLITPSTEEPVFFAASSPDVSINYLGLC